MFNSLHTNRLPCQKKPPREARQRQAIIQKSARKDARKSGTEREKRRKQTSTQTREKGPPFDPEAGRGSFMGRLLKARQNQSSRGSKTYTTFLHNFPTHTQLFYTIFLHNLFTHTQLSYTIFLHNFSTHTQLSYTIFLHNFFFAGKWTGGQPR